MPKQKIIYFVFLGLIIIFSLLGWHSLNNLLFNAPTAKNIVLVVIVFLLLAALVGTAVVLFDFLSWLLLASGLSLSLFLATFAFEPVYLLALAICIGMLIPALRRANKEKNTRLKIKVSEISRPATSIFFTVLALLISLVLYFSPPAQNLGVEIKIPRPLFNLVFDATTGFLNNQIKSQSTQPSGLPIGLAGLPGVSPSDTTKALAGQNLDLSKILNQEAKDNLYKTVNEQINFFAKPYKRYLPYGFAVAIFFTLFTFRFIFVWLSILLSQLIFNIMKSLKFVGIKKEMVEKEIIEI